MHTPDKRRHLFCLYLQQRISLIFPLIKMCILMYSHVLLTHPPGLIPCSAHSCFQNSIPTITQHNTRVQCCIGLELTLIATLSQLYRNDFSRHEEQLLLLSSLIHDPQDTNHAKILSRYSRQMYQLLLIKIYVSAYTFNLITRHVTCALHRNCQEEASACFHG